MTVESPSPAPVPAPAPAGAGAANKIGPIAGLVFVVLFVVSFMLTDTPEGDDGDEKWLSYWQDSDNRFTGIVSSLAMLLAAAAFLWFLGGLRRRLGNAPGVDAAYGAGIVMATLLSFAGFSMGLIPVGHELADIPIPTDADVVRLIDGGYFGVIFLAVPYAMVAFLLPLTYALRRSTMVPKWLWIAGLVIGIIALSGPFLFVVPHALFLIWMIIVCILLLKRERAAV